MREKILAVLDRPLTDAAKVHPLVEAEFRDRQLRDIRKIVEQSSHE